MKTQKFCAAAVASQAVGTVMETLQMTAADAIYEILENHEVYRQSWGINRRQAKAVLAEISLIQAQYE